MRFVYRNSQQKLTTGKQSEKANRPRKAGIMSEQVGEQELRQQPHGYGATTDYLARD